MKMNRISTLSALAILSLILLAACSTLNREPRTDPEPVAPSQVSDFSTLYTQNCAACHGTEGRGGASIALANPVYLAIVDETTMRNIVAKGVRGTSMPAFAQSAGGMLTERQIELARFRRKRVGLSRGRIGRREHVHDLVRMIDQRLERLDPKRSLSK